MVSYIRTKQPQSMWDLSSTAKSVCVTVLLFKSLFWNTRYAGTSTLPQQKFVGVRSTLTHIRYLMHWGLAYQCMIPSCSCSFQSHSHCSAGLPLPHTCLSYHCCWSCCRMLLVWCPTWLFKMPHDPRAPCDGAMSLYSNLGISCCPHLNSGTRHFGTFCTASKIIILARAFCVNVICNPDESDVC